jgi:hypothetical protein
MQKISGDNESPWNILLIISVDLDYINSSFAFSWSSVLHFFSDNLRNLRILLFTPVSSIDFPIQ